MKKNCIIAGISLNISNPIETLSELIWLNWGANCLFIHCLMRIDKQKADFVCICKSVLLPKVYVGKFNLAGENSTVEHYKSWFRYVATKIYQGFFVVLASDCPKQPSKIGFHHGFWTPKSVQNVQNCENGPKCYKSSLLTFSIIRWRIFNLPLILGILVFTTSWLRTFLYFS